MLVVTGWAVVYQLSQTVPVVTPGTSAKLSSPCGSNLVQVSPSPPSGSQSSGSILFECNSSPGPLSYALNETGGDNAVAIPTFDLTGTGYTGMFIVTHSSVATDCTTASQAGPTTTLSSGNVVHFPGGNNGYDYCLTYASVPTLPNTFGSFTIKWE